MYSELIYEAQKAVIQERLDKASRLQATARPRLSTTRTGHRRIAAIAVALGRKAAPVT